MEPMNLKEKKQNISEGESSVVDIISNLPNFVLSHILSFLPTTKEAVATSILSKRWRYVWISVDKLIFYNMIYYDKSVYKVLKHHQGNIKDFILSGSLSRCKQLDVISWVNTAVSQGVERLHVGISFHDEIPDWPLSILSCKTLVDLKIWGLYNVTMDIPTTPIFPCLKKLEVMYCGRCGAYIKSIVSRCSALEHFVGFIDGTPVEIVSSSIKRLELRSDRGFEPDYKIILCVPSLQYLKVYCALPLEFIVEEQLSSLIEADIYFCEYLCYSRYANVKELRDSFVRFIQPFSNVKLLRITSSCNKFFNSVGHGVFVNLTKLEIVSSFFEWRLLLCFMESSINLETVSLKKTSTLKKHKLAWKPLKKVPTSLSSSLKKISIDGYTEEELSMVKYVLSTAQILEQVDIHCAICYKGNNDWKNDMLQNLRKLHRACKRCEFFLV